MDFRAYGIKLSSIMYLSISCRLTFCHLVYYPYKHWFTPIILRLTFMSPHMLSIQTFNSHHVIHLLIVHRSEPACYILCLLLASSCVCLFMLTVTWHRDFALHSILWQSGPFKSHYSCLNPNNSAALTSSWINSLYSCHVPITFHHSGVIYWSPHFLLISQYIYIGSYHW